MLKFKLRLTLCTKDWMSLTASPRSSRDSLASREAVTSGNGLPLPSAALRGAKISPLASGALPVLNVEGSDISDVHFSCLAKERRKGHPSSQYRVSDRSRA